MTGAEDPARSATGARYHVAVAALVAAALGPVVASWNGIGVTSDSAGYLAAAESLLAGEGFRHYTGEPSGWWPPGYPALLAALGAIGLPLRIAAGGLNALAMAGTIVLGAHLARRLTERRGTTLFVAWALVPGFPLVRATAKVWTEPLFTFLLLAFVVWAPRVLETRRFGPVLMWAAVAGLAALVRYTGLALAGAGGVLLLVGLGTVRQRIGRAVMFGAVGMVPVGLWLMRNVAAGIGLTGTRTEDGRAVLDVLMAAAATVGGWLWPGPWPAWLLVTVFALGLGGLAWTWWRYGPFARQRAVALTAMTTTAFFLLLSIAASVRTTVDPLNDRLLAPLFPLFVLLLATTAAALLDRDVHRRSVQVALSAWLLLMTCWTGAFVVYRAVDGGGGYITRAWQASETLVLAASLPDTARVFSTMPEALYALHGRRSRRLRTATPADRGALVVWFGRGYGPDSVPTADFPEDMPEAIPPGLRLAEVERVADGGLYRIESTLAD